MHSPLLHHIMYSPLLLLLALRPLPLASRLCLELSQSVLIRQIWAL